MLGSQRFRLLGSVLLLLAPFSLGFGPPHLLESDDGKLPVYQYQLRLLREFQPVPLVSSAYLVMDQTTGHAVYEYNADKRIAPASITKIMTAIVVLEKGNLKDRVVIQGKHLSWGSLMGISPGDVLTVEDLLWGLLLPSGNDAALALADKVGGGSIERFVEMMNDKAAELGMRGTHFVNPHGLDEEGHFTTARDIALMSRYAMRNPLFARIVGTNDIVIQASRPFALQNSNQLLRRKNLVPGVNGIKTGLTENAGDSVVASVNRNGRQLIAVVMGTDDRTANAIRLLDFVTEEFTWVPLRAPFVREFADTNGVVRQLRMPEHQEELIPRWKRFYLLPTFRLDKHHNPFWPGMQVGTVSFNLAGIPVSSLPATIK